MRLPSSLPSGLTARLTVAMALTAALSALLAGLLTAPLLASTADDAVRRPLAQQAELLARLPLAVLASESPRRRLGAPRSLEVGVVGRDGSTTGPATSLTEAEVAALLAGEAVSTTHEYDGSRVVLEARPSRAGGAVVLAGPTTLVDDLDRTLRRRVLLAITLGLLAAVLVGWLLARRVARPLAATAAAARRLADGERGVALPEAPVREVRDVTAALGGLDAALADSEDRQRRFLLSVSHELRTPLTSIRGYSEALADGVVPPEEVAEVGATMRAESERLAGYVGDLLRLARMQADGFTVDPAVTDLAPVLTAAADAWAVTGRATGVTVAAVVPGPLAVRTDAARVRQVLDALVDNAVRVCGEGDTVTLTGRVEDDAVVLEVADTGPGLTDDDLTVAFEPGVLHDRYAGSRPVGHGLGLAIVARVVAALGGTVTARRRAEDEDGDGGGTVMAVLLPT